MQGDAPFEKKSKFWFETKKARFARDARNLENARRFEEWKAASKKKHYLFVGIWITSLVAIVWWSGEALFTIPWLVIGFFAYVVFRHSNQQPPMVKRSNADNQEFYASRIGVAGAVAGVVGGAQLGAGIGIVGGPLGAISGIIPGGIIGGIIGLFGGRKAGAHLGGSREHISSDSHLERRKTKAARVGRIAGLLAGAGSGAWVGAGVGLAAGPLGAAAGTIPGAVIGGIIGFFGGETVGAHIPAAKHNKPPRK
jgi:hypothetical protein